MMKDMTPEHIAKACKGTYHGPEEIKQQCVGGIAIDSRLIQPGWLFVATRGERVDGHSFVGQVMENGALCVLVEQVPDTDCPYILVLDTFQAIKDIAAYYRSCLSCKVVGITGSVGKTSTKEMIADTNPLLSAVKNGEPKIFIPQIRNAKALMRTALFVISNKTAS